MSLLLTGSKQGPEKQAHKNTANSSLTKEHEGFGRESCVFAATAADSFLWKAEHRQIWQHSGLKEIFSIVLSIWTWLCLGEA